MHAHITSFSGSQVYAYSSLVNPYVTWFVIRQHFYIWQNICDFICEKGLLLKHFKKLYINSCYIFTTIHDNCVYTKLFLMFLTVASFHKSSHKCFDISGPLLQIMSHNFPNSVNVLNNLLVYSPYIESYTCMKLT